MQDTMKAYSNYGDGLLVFGSEESLVTSYLELAEDPISSLYLHTPVFSYSFNILDDLPETFTICSSALIKDVTVDKHFFQLYRVRPGFPIKIYF